MISKAHWTVLRNTLLSHENIVLVNILVKYTILFH